MTLSIHNPLWQNLRLLPTDARCVPSSNEDGDFTDCALLVKLFADNVRFLDLTKEPLPEPRQVFVPIKG